MRPHTCLCAARFARFSSLLSHSGGEPSPPKRDAARSQRRVLQRMVALVMALILLPLAQVELFAQQAPWQGTPQYGQYAPGPYGQGGAYSQQYAPNQQPGYGQPGYPQPGYAQPQYAPPQQQPSSQQLLAGPPYADLDQGDQQPGYGQAQPFTAEQLEQMVAPIALYPDALLAQVLAAATYPAQVSIANQWLRMQGNAAPEQIAAGADAQNWDPSVKSLTAFPQVLAQMDHDLAWATDLGNAYYNQPQDVLQTVQVMRQRARAAGNLQNTPQEEVTYDQGNIELAPPNPQVAYVPSYNPWNVYGDPVQPYPGFSLLGTLGSLLGSSPIQYGLGIAMSAFTHTGFGWLSWALDWLGNSILFNHSNYYSQSTTVARWGSSGGSGYGGREWAGGYGQRNSYGRDQYDHAQNNFDRQGYGRNGSNWNSGQGREPGFTRQPDNYAGSRSYYGNGFTDGRDRGYAARPGYDTRPQYGNGYGQQNRYGYGNFVRPALPAYAYNRSEERPQAMPARPQQSFASRPYPQQSYVRPSYGSGFYGGAGSVYGGRPGGFSSAPQRGDPAQHQSFWHHSDSTPRSAPMSRGYSGFSSKAEHSGGFHLFGGGHSSGNSFGGGKPPKNFGGGSHGGGHGGGGGHSSGHGGIFGHHH